MRIARSSALGVPYPDKSAADARSARQLSVRRHKGISVAPRPAPRCFFPLCRAQQISRPRSRPKRAKRLWRAGSSVSPSARLTAQERRNFELVLLMRARLVGNPRMLFRGLRRARPAAGACHIRHARGLGPAAVAAPARRRGRTGSRAGARRRLLMPPGAERSDALKQRTALGFALRLRRRFAAMGADLVLRRQRQIVDLRHALRPDDRRFGGRRE